MFKKLVVLLMIVSIILAFGMTAYALPTDGSEPDSTTAPTVTDTASPEAGVKDEPKITFEEMFAGIVQNTDNTKQFLVTITRPDKEKDCAYEKSYVLTGIAKKSDVRICIFKQNSETGLYEELENTDGETFWNVTEGSAFSKEILLTKGANTIKIVAYSTADTSILKEKDVQVNSFTVSLIDKSLKEKVQDIINNFADSIKNILGGNK